MPDQHLAAAAGPGADANGRDFQRGGDRLGGGLDNQFQHDGKTSGLLQTTSVNYQALPIAGIAALHAVAADSQHALWRESQVAHHRHAGGADPRDRLQRGIVSAFQLYCGGAPFLQEGDRILQCIFQAALIGTKRHVADDEGLRCPPAYQATVVEHVFHCHGQRIAMSLYSITQRIADQQGVDRACRGQPGHARIVTGDDADPLSGGAALPPLMRVTQWFAIAFTHCHSNKAPSSLRST